MRDSAIGPVTVPPGFWTRTDVTDALTRRDIGALFRLLKQWAGLSQTRIGTATGNAQGRVSEIVHDRYSVRGLDALTRIADGLAMPDHARMALGLAPGSGEIIQSGVTGHLLPSADYPATTEQAITASIDLWTADEASSGAATSPVLDPAQWNAAALGWLTGQPGYSPTEDRTGRAVGQADVDRVRRSLVIFGELDNRFGGAHAHRALIHYLDREAATLLTGRYTEPVGRELFAAVAEASLLGAWTSYDCGLHGLAQRYFTQALRLAQSAAETRLACSILSAMSHQATYLGHLTEAATLARAAWGGLRDQATPALTAQFRAMEARALARAGDTAGCHTALAAADQAFQIPEPGRDPDFIAYFTEAELAAEIAHCYRDLGDANRAFEHATLATPSDGQYARSDFFAAMVLADACADQGDLAQACSVALQALQVGEALTSARCVSYVQEFRHRLAPFRADPAIREFTEQAAQRTLWIKAA